VRGVCLAQGVDAAPALRRQAAFATSDRRVRGAIMKILAREREIPLRRLRDAVADRRAVRLVQQLAAEGMLVVARDRVSLPG
jgi:hypothetical protein